MSESSEYKPEEFIDPVAQELQASGHYKDKTVIREQLKTDTEEFLAKGGTIEVLPPDERTENFRYTSSDRIWGKMRYGDSTELPDLD